MDIKNQDDIWITVIRIIDIQIKIWNSQKTVNIYTDLFQKSVIYSRTLFIREAKIDLIGPLNEVVISCLP